jgi:hypothetical protein
VVVVSVAATTVASARYVRPAPAQAGRYGGFHQTELISFKVLPNRVVKAFLFQSLLECHNSDTGENYTRAFSARNIGGGKVNFAGVWRREYVAEDGGREGRGHVEAHFPRDRAPFASATVFVAQQGGGLESCHGSVDLNVQRGAL